MQSLKQKYNEYLKNNPNNYLINIAKDLNVSEAELLNCKDDQNVKNLKSSFKEILLKLESLGEVMCVTRNKSCVHERFGV